MDISFVSGQEKFNYRVCAIILSGNRILAMHDERSPYYYLPGGRVRMGETAEHAVVREVEEELNIKSKIVRPLWLNQGFFTEDVDKLNYHEICLYFLMDVSETGLLEKGERFTLHEGKHMLVSIPPKLSVASFMGYLKGKSSLMMFDRHTNLKYKFGNRHFWAEGYYVSTVGLNDATVKKYIRDQERADIIKDKMSVKEY